MISRAIKSGSVKLLANDFIQSDLHANIIKFSLSDKKILLQLDPPISVAGVIYTHAIASPRLPKDTIDTLAATGTLGCAITWLSKERFDINASFDLNWWRGGSVAITDVILD